MEIPLRGIYRCLCWICRSRPQYGGNTPDGGRLAASLESHHPRIRAGRSLGLNLDSAEVSLSPVWVMAGFGEPPRHWA